MPCSASEASACIPSSGEAAPDVFQAAHKVTHYNYIIHIWRFISVEPWEQNKRHFLFAEIFLRCADIAGLLLLNFFFAFLTLHAKTPHCLTPLIILPPHTSPIPPAGCGGLHWHGAAALICSYPGIGCEAKCRWFTSAHRRLRQWESWYKES